VAKALASGDTRTAALSNVGLILARLRDGEAIALHKRAAVAEPANAEIHTQLGNALLAQQRYASAQVAFEESIRLAPKNERAHNGLGTVLDRLGRSNEAAGAFRSALALNPEFADAACSLGKVLLDTGDIDAAIECFERALALEPRNVRFHWYLVFSRSGSIDQQKLADMERLRDEIDTLPRTERVELHFALASAYEAVARYDDAFEQLRAGNLLKRDAIRYDETATHQLLAALKEVFTQLLSCSTLRECGNPSPRPIFVFGMPRSGTTLVEQLLSAHPTVIAAGELPVLEIALHERRSELWPATDAGFGEIPVSMIRRQIRAIGDRYLSATDVIAGNAPRLTDKQPHNFSLAPLIHLALPNARMIHVKRDRLDTCLSCFATLFAGQALPYAYDLGELARYYRAYEGLMANWRALLPADRFIEVDYESLINDFEAEARRLVAFCGLPWDARTLAFHEVRGSVFTASKVQVRRPLYRSAVGRSRRFAAHLGPLRDALTN
jgi:tetratricopeptide (TPR) repeat protein